MSSSVVSGQMHTALHAMRKTVSLRSPAGCLFFTLQTSYLFKQAHTLAVVRIYHKAYIICLSLWLSSFLS